MNFAKNALRSVVIPAAVTSLFQVGINQVVRQTRYSENQELVIKSMGADKFEKIICKNGAHLSGILPDRLNSMVAQNLENAADSINLKHACDSVKTAVIDSLKKTGKLKP